MNSPSAKDIPKLYCVGVIPYDHLQLPGLLFSHYLVLTTESVAKGQAPITRWRGRIPQEKLEQINAHIRHDDNCTQIVHLRQEHTREISVRTYL